MAVEINVKQESKFCYNCLCKPKIWFNSLRGNHFIFINLLDSILIKKIKEMLLLFSKYLVPKGYRGLAVFPFVFVKFKMDKKNLIFINHERIHLRQQLEMLVFPFFIWYFFEYFVRLIQYKNRNLAYRNISFEREAYANEHNLYYLKQKSLWGFLKYV